MSKRAGCSNPQAEVGSRDDSEKEGQGHIHPDAEPDENHGDESVHQQSELQTLSGEASFYQNWELPSGVHQTKKAV